MNWDAIGAVSDLVAASAVVVTLAYLAVQVREAHKTTVSHATFISVDLASKWRSALIQDTQMAEILIKANSGAALSEIEKLKLSTFAEDLFALASVSFEVSAQSGALHKDAGEVKYLMGKLEKNPGLVKEWYEQSALIDLISTNFLSLVNTQLTNRGLSGTAE